MLTSRFDYELPDDLVARHPPAERDAARLLELRREGVVHRRALDWPDLVPAGSLVVLNDTRVLRARLIGARRPGKGRVEIFLLRRRSTPGETEAWSALGRATRPLRAGDVVDVADAVITVTQAAVEGTLSVEVRARGGVEAAVERLGHVPIPPYLGREDEPDDAGRYQTTFARVSGSVAAPTAGLHLSPALLDRLRARGVHIATLTLHVGLGTFRPVSVPDLDQHVMHAEEFDVPDALVQEVADARARRAPVVAVGTTVVRALESAQDLRRRGHLRACSDDTRLLIQPGYSFGVVDALLTNFHQPRSTLLALVAAFAGLDRVRAAYSAAIAQRYRFLSYGDAMWLPERLA